MSERCVFSWMFAVSMHLLLLVGIFLLFVGCGGGLQESYFEPEFTGAEMEVQTEEDGVSGHATGGMAFGPIQADAEVGGVFFEDAAWLMVGLEIKYLAAFSTRVTFECDFYAEVCNLCARSMGTEVCRTVVGDERVEVEPKPTIDLTQDSGGLQNE